MAVNRLGSETAESVAGVVRLLRRAAELGWAQADAQGAGSSRQVFALGVDLVADEARNLLDDQARLEGPVPVGDDPAGLLRSAEQLVRRIGLLEAPVELDRLQTLVRELVWEAATGADG